MLAERTGGGLPNFGIGWLGGQPTGDGAQEGITPGTGSAPAAIRMASNCLSEKDIGAVMLAKAVITPLSIAMSGIVVVASSTDMAVLSWGCNRARGDTHESRVPRRR
jgi:hypothetical protein